MPDFAPIEIKVFDEDGQLAAVFQLAVDGDYLIGRESAGAQLPLSDSSVSRRHATLRLAGGRLLVADDGSTNGSELAGIGPSPRRLTGDFIEWPTEATLFAGIYRLTRSRPGEGAPQPLAEEAIDPSHDPAEDATSVVGHRPRGVAAAAGAPPLPDLDPFDSSSRSDDFPRSVFNGRQVIPVHELRQSGKLAGETDYLAIGGGVGSFIWVDHLRVFGVAEGQIRVIGVNANSWDKWGEYCENSQIPPRERIRSNSISTPDNIWGFPGYASRETLSELGRGNLKALKYVFQVFGEPALAESYTPRLSHIFSSMAKEQQRIGWSRMFAFGRAIALRKTDDGRFVLAYRVPHDQSDGGDRDRFWIARHVHLATGYPSTRYLPILQAFKRKHRDNIQVVNAYENHEAVYRRLEQKGGTVVVQGRGIVASRVLQRLYEARAKNRQISVLHLMRSPVARGHAFDLSRRSVSHDVELQPFNWPKSCWGGAYRRLLEEASPDERAKLMSDWGGTTTAERSDWIEIINVGKREGWYRAYYGEVDKIRLRDDKVITMIRSKGQFSETLDLAADYLIDCTGLVADATSSPFLKDILDTYKVPRNKVSGSGPEQQLAGLTVTSQFEIKALRNGDGRVYGAGVVTANGPYAAVDSFLGLAYAALRSVDHLAYLRAPSVRRTGPLRSFGQWLKWCAGAAP